jgi:hypothetical protein
VRERLTDWILIDARTWSPTINELVKEGTVGLGPYELKLDYDYWTYSKEGTGILLLNALTLLR